MSETENNNFPENCNVRLPVVAIVDTNGNPELADYPVAANDDAVKSIKVIFDTFTEAIKDASEIYKVKAAEEKAKEDEEKAKAKAEGADKAKRAPKGETAKRAPRKTIRKNADGEAAEKTAGNEEAAAEPAKKPARKRAVKEVKTLSEIKKSDVAAE